MMPRFWVLAPQEIEFHHPEKAEGEASLDISGIPFFICYPGDV